MSTEVELLGAEQVLSTTPLVANGIFQSGLITIGRHDRVVLVYAESDEAGTIYVIFTDSTGTFVVGIAPSGSGQATSSASSAPSGTKSPSGTPLVSGQSAYVRATVQSPFFYVVYVNGSSVQTLFEVGMRTEVA